MQVFSSTTSGWIGIGIRFCTYSDDASTRTRAR
jgi:hypothetical protein